MRKIILFLTSLIFLKFELFAAVVIIDPGHGGYDAGAVRDFFKESEITLNIAQKIQNLFKESDTKIELTRNADVFLSLDQRVQMANQAKADLFISLHANSIKETYVSGMEFYFKKGIKPLKISNHQKYEKSEPSESLDLTSKQKRYINQIVSELALFGQLRESLKFNQILQNEFQNQTQKTKSVIKQAPFFVIENSDHPSVLIEVGYISNLSEAKQLVSDQRQSEIAETIAKSIRAFLNNSR